MCMKVSGIGANYAFLKKSKQNMDNKVGHLPINNYHSQPIKNVSFGFVGMPVIDPVLYFSVIAAEVVILGTGMAIHEGVKKHKDYKKYITAYSELMANDIEKYKEAYNCSEKEAKSIYMKRFKTFFNNHYKLSEFDKGLNRMQCNLVERFQLLTSAVMPMVNASQSTEDKRLVPNGVLLYGQDSEKTGKLVEAFKNHCSALDVYVQTVDLGDKDNFDPKKAVGRLLTVHDNMLEHNKYFKQYSMIHIKNVDSISKDEHCYALDLLKSYMENATDNRVIFVIDSQDPSAIDKTLLRPGRCDLKISVGNE